MTVTASTPGRDPEPALDLLRRTLRLVEDLDAIEGVRAHLTIHVDVRLAADDAEDDA